jgi:protein SCO1
LPRSFAPLAALAGAAIVLLVVALALTLWQGPRGPFGGALFPAIGGPFRLVDQTGKTVTDKDLLGKWSLVYFGYTRCEDECPEALNNIALALDRLGGQERERVRAVFITVDPKHDTPAVLRSYVAKFAAPILALTGTEGEIAQAAKAYRVYYAKPSQQEVEHSSIIYLMDPRGRFATNFTNATKPAEIARTLKKRLS